LLGRGSTARKPTRDWPWLRLVPAGGDRAGEKRLRQAVEQGQDVDAAARGLARLAIPLCPLVKEKLEGPAGEARGAAVVALGFGLERECLPGGAGGGE